MTVKQLADQAFEMAKTEEEEGLGAEIRGELETARGAAKEALVTAALDRGEEEPEIDETTLEVPVPEKMLY